MKLNFSFFLIALLLTQTWCIINAFSHDCFTGAFTAGYVFKHDDTIFKEVYGHGMGNIITGDLCYYPWQCWGFGGKISYWLAFGKTTFFRRHTTLQEIPILFYVRRLFTFRSCLQLYASLGGGFAWMGEKSYLGHTSQTRGLGEVEIGLNYPLWCDLDFTSAFRYLFPRQSNKGIKIDVGGFDLRAGVGFSF